ncbi:hypothetical protein EG329_013846 [Mollisiaceae sp. DMI_Dod_QoI]|nr:hypothetical protein EG329_013846 [Helotiales sp. DMI_Dod_QoI]
MARPSLIDRIGPEVLQRLPSSPTINVKCRYGQLNGSTLVISLPEVLACAVSSRFRDLCKNTAKRDFMEEDIVGEPLCHYEEKLALSTFYSNMCLFQRWLYGADLSKDDDYCYERWYFGQTIGAPLYQNDVMRDLSSTVDVEAKSLWTKFHDRFDFFTLNWIWKQSEITVDQEHNHDELDRMQWANKQMLKFVLDTFAFEGPKESSVALVIEQGGPWVIHIVRIMDDAIRAGGFDGAPWEDANLHKYILDERLPEYRRNKSVVAKVQLLEASGSKNSLKRKSPPH